MDITYVQTEDNGLQKVAFVKDNYSKAILHYASTHDKAGSAFIKKLLEETFEKYDLYNQKEPVNILSDGGPENKGEVISWVNNIKAPPVVSKITARTDDFPYSNSMSESTHSIYKSEFMQGKISKNTEIHLISLEKFIIYYNEHRFFTEHYGLTPLEVLNGKIPDKKLYKEQIIQARKNRLKANASFNACIPKYKWSGVPKKQ